MENLLEISINIRILINLLFDEEQIKKLNKIPSFGLIDHLDENYNI
jgi:hypothetical protein